MKLHVLLYYLFIYLFIYLYNLLYFIRLGAHYRTTGSVGTEQEIGVAQIIRHESYNNPLRLSNDIALILSLIHI